MVASCYRNWRYKRRPDSYMAAYAEFTFCHRRGRIGGSAREERLVDCASVYGKEVTKTNLKKPEISYLHSRSDFVVSFILIKVVAKSLIHWTTLFLYVLEQGDSEDIRGFSRSKPLQYSDWTSLMFGISTLSVLLKQLSLLLKNR